MAAIGPGANFPLTVVGQIVRFDITCWVSARSQTGMYSVYHRVASVSGAGTTLGLATTNINSMYSTFTKNITNAGSTFLGTVGRMIVPTPPSPPAYETSTAGAGAVAGDMLPPQTAGLITVWTRYAGRGYRGRRYIPFPSESDNDPAAVPSAAYQAILTSIAGQIATTVNVGGADGVSLVPVLFHKRTNSFTDVLGAAARTGWATQRRRGFYGRQNTRPF